MSTPGYATHVNYVAVVAFTLRVPYEERHNPSNNTITRALLKRLCDLNENNEWREALELTDPIMEDEDGNPINNEDDYSL